MEDKFYRTDINCGVYLGV